MLSGWFLRSSPRLIKYQGVVVGVIAFTLHMTYAQAGPLDGVVSGGNAAISASGAETLITQTTDRAIIDWRSFDTSANERVIFQQPTNSAIMLNRINDSKATSFDGVLTANGNVWMTNPHGIVFGRNAQVDVGGLLATSSDIDNEDFLSGFFTFRKPGIANAVIENRGKIQIAPGGSALLVAPNVYNSGAIAANLGKVRLASGDVFVADPYGDGLINLEITSPSTGQNVSNSGVIVADEGTVSLTAAAPDEAVNATVSTSGMIFARGGKVSLYAEGSNAVKGNVVIDKGKKQGTTTSWVDGGIVVESGIAGQVDVQGDHVALLANASIDASGTEAGGVVRIGGSYQGKGVAPSSLHTYVDRGAVVDVSATGIGNAGRVIVWSDDKTG